MTTPEPLHWDPNPAGGALGGNVDLNLSDAEITRAADYEELSEAGKAMYRPVADAAAAKAAWAIVDYLDEEAEALLTFSGKRREDTANGLRGNALKTRAKSIASSLEAAGLPRPTGGDHASE